MIRKTALVTGAHGSIGRQVALLLSARNWQVTGLGHGNWECVDHRAWGLSSWHEGDVALENLRALDVRPTLVIHCAGSGAVGTSLAAPYMDFRRTVESTAVILVFLRVDCPESTLVFPSSAAVYGVTDRLPMVEDMLLRPTSPYGVHKKIAEELVAEYAKWFGLKTIVVRLFSVYGEGFRKQLLWDACQKIMRDDSNFFGTGEETRDWLHVSDAADLLLQASDHASASCPVVNGGYGEPVSVRDVLTELFRLMGRNDSPKFSRTRRAGDPLHYHADMRRAFAWGWRPKIPWRVGLERYQSWYRREHEHI